VLPFHADGLFHRNMDILSVSTIKFNHVCMPETRYLADSFPSFLTKGKAAAHAAAQV